MVKIRPLTEADRPLLEQWIATDPHHQNGEISADFFYAPDTNALVYEDEHGIVFVARFARTLRIHMQFSPDEKRNAAVMLEGFPILEFNAKEAGFKELIFDSMFRPLIVFCKRKLGFRASPDELVRYL